jgi:beta-lactamase superfamily II metal-dependent hydrolase
MCLSPPPATIVVVLTLEIHHLGLKAKGDATLVVVKQDNAILRTLLIDGGTSDAIPSTMFDRILGNAPLDYVIATHYHADHIGGLPLAMRHLARPGFVADRGVPLKMTVKITAADLVKYSYAFDDNDSDTKKALRAYLEAAGCINTWTPGYAGRGDDRATAAVIAHTDLYGSVTVDQRTFVGETRFGQHAFEDPTWLTTLAPLVLAEEGAQKVTLTFVTANTSVRKLDATTGEATSERVFELHPELTDEDMLRSVENQSSVGVVIELDNFRYFCGGDLESTQEIELVAPRNDKNKVGFLYGKQVHALKLSHHGSKTASSELFLASIQPSVAVISNGLDNMHRHPSVETQALLDKRGLVGRNASILNPLCGYYMTGWFYKDLKGHVAYPRLAADCPRARVAGTPPTAGRDATAGSIAVIVTGDGARANPPSFRVECDGRTPDILTAAPYESRVNV